MSRHAPAVLETFDAFCAIVNGEAALPVEERMKHALAELLAPKNDLLRRRAATIAQPIAERHAVPVAALFGRSKARDVVAARDELYAALLASGWSQANVMRALGVSERDPARGAARWRARVGSIRSERKVATR